MTDAMDNDINEAVGALVRSFDFQDYQTRRTLASSLLTAAFQLAAMGKGRTGACDYLRFSADLIEAHTRPENIQ